MTHYNHNSESLDHINFDIVQDEKGVICIANRSGILKFDGSSWEHINTASAIFSLAIDPQNNTLYASGYNGFGKVMLDENYQEIFLTLQDSSQIIKNVYSLILKDKLLYGLSEGAVYTYDLSTGKVNKIAPGYSGELYALHQMNDQLYVSTEKSGLQVIQEGQIKEAKNKLFDQLEVVFTRSHTASGNTLIGTVDGNLYLSVANTVKQLDVKDVDNYLPNSDFTDAVWVNESLVALSSLKGGVIFLDLQTKEIKQIINYQTGLPDNEILAISKDSNGGVWVAHNVGFTRISPHLPFHTYSNYEGLNGTILTAINHNDSLYVGTSLGLYFLDKVKNYENVNVTVKEQITVKKKAEPVSDRKRKGSLLGFLKKKEEGENVNSKTETKTVYRSQTKQIVKSVDYQYQKAENLISKVQHFSSYKGQLYCAGLDGVFKVNGSKAIKIYGEPVNYLAIAEKSQLLIAATHSNQIKTFSLSGANAEVDLFYDFRDDVDHIFEDDEGRIWLTSTDEVYYITVQNGEIGESDSYALDNPYFYATLGGVVNGTPIFINESGKFKIDLKTNQLIYEDSLSDSRYLAGANGEVWIYNNDNWRTLQDREENKKLNLLSVFKNISDISTDANKNYWVVTENNELYKIENEASQLSDPYDIYLKYVKTSDKTFLPDKKLRIEQSKSSLYFEFAQPEFSGILDIKYQYKLEGLESEWSEWSSAYNKISFPYLPEGKYQLKVRSKNILGTIKDVEPIAFEVVPPYWKRPWFYAFEFTALIMLLFVSVRLKDLGFKYRLASRLIALVTLIIIIEFIQTVAENRFSSESSPVFDFLVQVTVAIIVLPVESLIRKYIFREKNVQILDFVQLKDKNTRK